MHGLFIYAVLIFMNSLKVNMCLFVPGLIPLPNFLALPFSANMTKVTLFYKMSSFFNYIFY